MKNASSDKCRTNDDRFRKQSFFNSQRNNRFDKNHPWVQNSSMKAVMNSDLLIANCKTKPIQWGSHDHYLTES